MPRQNLLPSIACGRSDAELPANGRNNLNATGESLRSRPSHCPRCHRTVNPIRPPLPPKGWVAWTGLSVIAVVILLSGVVLWAAIGLILWRNSKATCPECGYDPIKGNVGWTRESIILWLLLATCFIISLWVTFWLIAAVTWIFNPVLD